MQILHTDSQLAIISAVFSGAGKANWQNAARITAMHISEANAASAEAAGLRFSVRANTMDLTISITALDSAILQASELLASCIQPCKLENSLFLRFESELLSEQSDFDLQAARGFNEALLGLKNDQSVPTNEQIARYFDYLRSCPMKLLVSCPQHADTSALSRLERAGYNAIALSPSTAAFNLQTTAPASQVFMYFGRFLGELDFAQRASAAIASAAFGGGFCSRLTEAVRVQNGLAYSAYARVAYLAQNAYWMGALQTERSNYSRAKELVKSLFSELKNGFSEEEFSSAKSYLLGSEILRQKDIFSAHQAALSAMQQGLASDYYKQLHEQIKRCDLAALNNWCEQFAGELSFYALLSEEQNFGKFAHIAKLPSEDENA